MVEIYIPIEVDCTAFANKSDSELLYNDYIKSILSKKSLVQVADTLEKALSTKKGKIITGPIMIIAAEVQEQYLQRQANGFMAFTGSEIKVLPDKSVIFNRIAHELMNFKWGVQLKFHQGVLNIHEETNTLALIQDLLDDFNLDKTSSQDEKEEAFYLIHKACVKKLKEIACCELYQEQEERLIEIYLDFKDNLVYKNRYMKSHSNLPTRDLDSLFKKEREVLDRKILKRKEKYHSAKTIAGRAWFFANDHAVIQTTDSNSQKANSM